MVEFSMTNHFQVRLPNWPPQRLVRESVYAWDLRHLDEPELDAATSSWPLVRGAILAFLRHLHSDFDERLRVRCEHDPKFRDELAAQIAAQAFRRYPWLGKDDPRPFPESEEDSVSLPFDELAKELADLHTRRDHLVSAIRDLRRQGNHSKEIAQLSTTLKETQHDIDWCYGFLSKPKILPEEGKTRLFVRTHPKKDGIDPGYIFYSGKEVTQNRIVYLGFRCPRCGVSVTRWKQIIPLGQGYRCIIFACHCTTCAVHTPGGVGRVEPMTAKHWARFCQRISRFPSAPLGSSRSAGSG
jgi:hypothetical protein